jgi:hypothetical protein
MTRWILAAAVAGVALALATIAQAAAENASGRVRSVRAEGVVTIESRDGTARRAGHGVPLIGGDRIVFHGPGVVEINLWGRDRTITDDFEVPLRDAGVLSQLEARYLDSLLLFLGRPRWYAPATLPAVRDPLAPMARVKPNDLAPTGIQHLPQGSTRVALVWDGGPTELAISPAASGGSPVINSRGARAVVSAPATARFTITAADGGLAWVVERGRVPPWPPWREPPTGTPSEAQRLVRAVWLLRDGPGDWRVFALGELEDLARAGNYAATQLWEAAGSGELQQELTAVMAAKPRRPE